MDAHDFEPKPGWNSANDDVVNDFYRPALRRCTRYDRLTGFFDSSTFAVAIREALDFVERGGRMRLVTSAKFSQADLDVIAKSVEDKLTEEVVAALEDDLGRKCLSIFGRMLATKIDGVSQLEIKILVPKRGMFHPKVGIFTMDNGDIISFSGSVNETGMGWTGNIEEFKAFCSWNGKEYVDIDVVNFQEFWNDSHVDIRAYDLPRAVREKILQVRPESDKEYRRLLQELKKKMYGERERDESDMLALRYYQNEAVNEWTSHGYCGIFEMPTATGKTFTAMGCINKLQKKSDRLFTVIVVPYQHLSQQWIDNVKKWNEKALPVQKISTNILNTVGNSKWEIRLRKAVNEFNKKKFIGGYIIDDYVVCTTYTTLVNPSFIDAIKNVDGKLLLVADEAHHAGASVSRTGLIEEYSARLALTATPNRYFDEEGSELIRSYFGGVVYSMDINQAIRNGHLVPYDYYPIFAELNAAETEEYRKLTRRIAQKLSQRKDKKPPEDISHSPEIKRSRLVAKIEQKYEKLAEILERHDNSLENALIYCHDGEQLKNVGRILSQRNINYEEITEASSMVKRRDTIQSLTNKNHQCIVAMECLDEGVDIPPARLGIIMASTGNTLQYIQRRGRLLRRFDGKDHAIIYDMLAAAPPDVDDQPYAKKLVAKELLRHKEFAESARNKNEALSMIRPVANRLGIDLKKLNRDYVLGL